MLDCCSVIIGVTHRISLHLTIEGRTAYPALPMKRCDYLDLMGNGDFYARGEVQSSRGGGRHTENVILQIGWKSVRCLWTTFRRCSVTTLYHSNLVMQIGRNSANRAELLDEAREPVCSAPSAAPLQDWTRQTDRNRANRRRGYDSLVLPNW